MIFDSLEEAIAAATAHKIKFVYTCRHYTGCGKWYVSATWKGNYAWSNPSVGF